MSAPLPNPLSDDTPDFLAFSAASTPRQEHFKPKRGKVNRQDNWRQFGRFENRQQNSPQNSSYFYPSPQNWSPSPRGWRGSPGSFRGQNRSGRFAAHGNFHQREGRGRGQHQRGHHRGHHNLENSYFHPSMLEDPWKDLRSKSQNTSLSDSLKPQVGDSFINPAPDVPDNLSSTDNSAITGSDKVDLEVNNSLSESMIPLYSEDSILERNNLV